MIGTDILTVQLQGFQSDGDRLLLAAEPCQCIGYIIVTVARQDVMLTDCFQVEIQRELKKRQRFLVSLGIVISSEGHVKQASVVRSSGQNALDAAIEAFVENNWRFLSAMLNGGAIQYATTIAIACTRRTRRRRQLAPRNRHRARMGSSPRMMTISGSRL
jgi:TonB family protein